MYIRINKEKTQFVVPEIHQILDTDILISDEEYNNFITLQEAGAKFRKKNVVDVNLGLFGIIEEFIPEINPTIPTDTELKIKALENENLEQTEMLIDNDFRLTNIELGL